MCAADLTKYVCCRLCQKLHSSETGCDVLLVLDAVTCEVYECSSRVASFNASAARDVKTLHEAEALFGTSELRRATLVAHPNDHPGAWHTTIHTLHATLFTLDHDMAAMAEEGFPNIIGGDRLRIPPEFSDLAALHRRVRTMLYYVTALQNYYRNQMWVDVETDVRLVGGRPWGAEG